MPRNVLDLNSLEECSLTLSIHVRMRAIEIMPSWPFASKFRNLMGVSLRALRPLNHEIEFLNGLSLGNVCISLD